MCMSVGVRAWLRSHRSGLNRTHGVRRPQDRYDGASHIRATNRGCSILSAAVSSGNTNTVDPAAETYDESDVE